MKCIVDTLYKNNQIIRYPLPYQLHYMKRTKIAHLAPASSYQPIPMVIKDTSSYMTEM